MQQFDFSKPPRLGPIEQLMADGPARALEGREAQTPGPLFALLRHQRRRTFPLLRWEVQVTVLVAAGLTAVIYGNFWVLLPVGLVIGASAVAMEREAAATTRRLVQSGIMADLMLAGQSHHSLLHDLESYFVSRSVWPHVAMLPVVLALLYLAPTLLLSNAQLSPSGMKLTNLTLATVQNGIHRGLGLGNPIGRMVIEEGTALSMVGAYLILLALPVLLFLGVLFLAGSTIGAIIALIVSVHAVIIVIAIRSGKPSPYGEMGEALTSAVQGVFTPPVYTDEELMELFVGRA